MEPKSATLLKQGFQQNSQLQKIITIFILNKMRWLKNENSHKEVYYLGKISEKCKHKPRKFGHHAYSVSYVLFSALLNSFIYTSRQLQILDIPSQLHIISWQWNISNDLNNSHQQSSKANMRNKCRNSRKHTLKAREVKSCRNFQQKESLEKMKMVRKKRNGNGKRKWQKFHLPFPFLIGLNKEKK